MDENVSDQDSNVKNYNKCVPDELNNNLTVSIVKRKSFLSGFCKRWDKYVYTLCIFLNYIFYVSLT